MKENKDNKKPQDEENEKVTKFLHDLKSTLKDTNFRKELKRVRKEKGIKPMKLWFKILLIIMILTLGGFYLNTLSTNKGIKLLESTRDKQLDAYEYTKFAVLESVKDYLTIKSNDDFKEVKASFNAPKWYKDELFGSKYDPKNFYGATSISSIDAQYTLEDKDGVTKYYLLLWVKKADEVHKIEMLVFVQNNQIFDIIIV